MEPGDDEKKAIEGSDDDEYTKFGKYRCVYRETSNSLFVMIKDTKSKRSFANTFSKSSLKKMDWRGSIEKMINFLKEAQQGKKEELSFKIAFGPSASGSQQGHVVVTDDGADGNETESSKVVSFGKLRKSYADGHAMYVLAAIETSYFGAEYLFELLEQERKEWDILRDIIADLQEEVDELKGKMAKMGTGTAMASWTTSGPFPGTHATLNGVRVAPTLEGMCHLSDDQKQIIVDKAGVYKIEAQVNHSSNCGAGHYLDIQVNGSTIRRKWGSTNGGFGVVNIYTALNQNDYIQFYANHVYATQPLYNSFTIIKM